jgi:uncharacterized repeat protein (TIGR04138 family)
MSDDSYSLLQLIKKDTRYTVDAYLFIREALAYAADALEMGSLSEPEPNLSLEQKQQQYRERHLTGQQLCDAIRLYGINQFGLMAQTVLKSWGVETTSAFGDIVYNMIEAGMMKKSPSDRRSHFNDVYDFDEVFNQQFRICNSVGNPVNLKDSLGSGQEF